MKRLLATLALLLSLGAIPSLATQGYPYASNCTGGCGIGSHIVGNSVSITLYDTANPGGASTIQAGTVITDYSGLPLTIDPTKLNVDWNTDASANGCVVAGSLLNNSDRIQCDVTSGLYNIGTHHHVTLQHLVPASHGGNANGSITLYVTSNINATSTDPQNRYSTGQNTYPGPQCYQGSTACYFNVFPPNPTAVLPMQWEASNAGVVSAIRGNPAQIPLYLLWTGGNATTIGAFAACDSGHLNQLAHTYAAGQWAAPNSGTWYQCKSTGWTSLGSQLPVFAVTSSTFTDPSANVNNCPGSLNGGESAGGIPRVPADTCTSGAGDSHVSVTPFYTGVYVGSSPTSDYRQIFYSSARSAYYFNTNGAAPPSNSVPVSSVQFFPATNAATGTYTGSITLTMYTDSSLSTVAAGTSPITFTYSINVADETPVVQVDPATYPTDSNLPAYMNYLSQESVGMCSDTGGGRYSLDYYNLSLHYWMWLTFGAGDWGPYNTGNYDNSRVFEEANDIFLHQMNGAAWPDWSATTAYGSSQSTMEVTPSSDPNGNTWVATVPGGTTAGTHPNWTSIPNPSASTLLTDGTQKWRNVGKGTYWNRCTENASVPFDNQVIQAGSSALWAQFTGAEEKHRQRTDDAVIKGTSTITGFYSAAEKLQINSSFGGGLWSQYSPAAGRGTAYELMSLATYWKTVCDQGNCAAFTNNDQLKRMAFWDINATIAYWNIHELSNAIGTDPTKTYWPTFDPLHFGVGAEALREWFIRDKELDPSNALNLADSRIVPELSKMLDFAYFHWYNQCRPFESTDNFSMSYNPMDVQTCAILEPYFTELTGPIQAAYDWIGRYNGNALMSDSSTTWYQAADLIRKHMYDGRNCSNPQGHWYCQQYGIPWAGGSGVPKTFGQTSKESLGNSYFYRTGAWTPFEDDLSPQHNPCWSGGSVPCTTPTPYPDTQQPYGVAILPSGSQDDPTCEASYTGKTCSPIQNVTSVSADFQINIYEPVASIRVDYGTTNACSTASSSTEEAGYPKLLHSANQLWQHLLLMSPLTPGTNYWARYCATDLAGNQSCSPCAAVSGGFRGGNIHFTTGTAPVQLQIITTTLPAASVNTFYDVFMQAQGGVAPYTWSESGSLPPGITFNTSTGEFSGTPTLGGTYPIDVSVTDHASNHAGPVHLQIVVNDLHFTTTSLPGGTRGVTYPGSLAAAGGLLPYTFSSVIGLLPPGLHVNTDGTFSGAPTACGNFPVTYQVKDANSLTARTIPALTITVTGCTGLLTVTGPPSLPNGLLNVIYPNQSYAIVGGVSPYTCTVSSGALPNGLSIGTSGSTCTISGTPTVLGLFQFTVQAQDSTTPTPLTAATPQQSITIQSDSQLSIDVTGSFTGSGSLTLGTPAPPPLPSPAGP